MGKGKGLSVLASASLLLLAPLNASASPPPNSSAGGNSANANSANHSASSNSANHSTGNAGTSGTSTQPQPLSNADRNSGGANGKCPGGPYCSTRHGAPSLNGNGNGKAVGKPCAGCVGKADNKNPAGQYPNGTDHNAGYECDRNHGIGRTNPAHTGCVSGTTPQTPPETPPGTPPSSSNHPPTPTTGASAPPSTPQGASLGTTTSTAPATTTRPGAGGVLGQRISAPTEFVSATHPAAATTSKQAKGNLPFTGENIALVAAIGLLLMAASLLPRWLTDRTRPA